MCVHIDGIARGIIYGVLHILLDAQFITAEANTDINTLCTHERIVCMAYLLLIAYNIRVQNSIPIH